LYHHFSIFLVYWLNTSAGYDGDIYFTIVVNSFIHFMMYSAYEAIIFNITVPRFVKRLFNNLKLIELVFTFIPTAYILVMRCPYPRHIALFFLFYNMSAFILFSFSKADIAGKNARERNIKHAFKNK
jgi:elongation of very long chain fatty acids protein 4